MANMIDYLDWRGDLTMDKDAFNDIDNIILAWLSTLPFSECESESIALASKTLLEKETLTADDRSLLTRLASCPRFSGMKVIDNTVLFDEKEQMQFSAFTADTLDGSAFIAFRGTDNTLVGWKEDFNMAFMQSVPAQREAVKYVERMAGEIDLPLRVGGHSKGGNLAVYAASLCDPQTRSRITVVYNNDGPGLSEAIMESEGYKAVSGRVKTFLPQSSIVGILLYHTEDYRVVSSTAIGPLQHNPHSWQVLGNEFVFEGGLRKGSQYMDKTLKKWLESMSTEERKVMVEAIYEIMASANLKTFRDLISNWRLSGAAMLAAAKGLSPESRKVLYKVFSELVAAGVESARHRKD